MVDPNESVYVFGFTDGTFADQERSTGTYDLFVAKLDAGGSLSWVRQFGATGNLSWTANGFAMATDRAGGVYVMWETSDGKGGVHSWVRRYAAGGAMTWENEILIGGPISVGGIATDPTGNVYVSGTTSDGKGVIAMLEPGTGQVLAVTTPPPAPVTASGAVTDAAGDPVPGIVANPPISFREPS